MQSPNAVIIQNKNNIITASHPSPLAKGFIRSNIFKQIDKLVLLVGIINLRFLIIFPMF